MTQMFALVDDAGVVRQAAFADLKLDGFRTFPLPDGFWLDDHRAEDGTWTRFVPPVVPAAPTLEDRVADLETKVAEVEDPTTNGGSGA